MLDESGWIFKMPLGPSSSANNPFFGSKATSKSRSNHSLKGERFINAITETNHEKQLTLWCYHEYWNSLRQK